MNKSMVILSLLGIVSAHQPVMDMAPRWAGGWGFQFRYETLGSDKNIGGEYGCCFEKYDIFPRGGVEEGA